MVKTMFYRLKLAERVTWLDSIPEIDGDNDLLSDNICTDAVYYVDLDTGTDLFTNIVANITSTTK